MRTIAARTGVVGLFCASFAAPLALGQLCEEGWLPQGQLPGADNGINASVMWDPDGSGPRTPLLVVGGTFANISNIRTSGIAAYDPSTGLWTAFGAGVNGSVSALAVAPDNTLLVGGSFVSAGGVQAFDLARWNGSAWSSLNFNSAAGVRAICVLPNNSIAVGGLIGSYVGRSLQIFDGAAWRQLGDVFENSSSDGVYSLASIRRPSGAWRLLVGGQFRLTNQTISNIATFDGIGWSSFGQIPSGVATVLSVPTGTNSQEIFAGLRNGSVTRWTGSGWQQMGGFFSDDPNAGSINALAAVPDVSGGFSLYTTGKFSRYNGNPLSSIARWTGLDWVSVAGGLGPSPSSAGPSGATLCPVPLRSGVGIFVGGFFSSAGNTGAENAAIFGEGQWSSLGIPGTQGVSDHVYTIAQTSPTEVVIGGRFSSVAGISANRIVKRTTSTASPWVPLGSGMNASVLSIVPVNGGELIAGGGFTTAGGTPANYIAQWNGQSWRPLGSGLNNPVGAMVALPNGDVVVTGSFTTAGGTPARGVAKWDGETWSALGDQIDGEVFDLAVVPRSDGVNWDLYAGGRFNFGSAIARWNGTQWTPVGSGVRVSSGERGAVYALESLPRAGGGSDLIAAGYFNFAGPTPVKHIARWNGTTWSHMGSINDADYVVYNLAVTRSRSGQPELAASGILEFTQIGFISRFTGANWQGWPSFVFDNPYGHIWAMSEVNNSPDGWRLAVGGTFTNIGGEVSPHFALWGCTSCRADFNRDGTFDFFDYLDFVFAFEMERDDADFDRSGSIDFFDYLEFVAAFAQGC